MSSIVRNKVGNHVYLYESVSYRDKNGKPQTRKTSIGKIDPLTGEPIYKPEYLDRVRGTEKQPDMSNIKMYSENDIKASDVREYGVFYLLENISDQIGLTDVLITALPGHWEQVLTLAYYMVATGDPGVYCEDWLMKTESLPCGRMSSQQISELLAVITNAERSSFYEGWGALRNEMEYMALDITSVSSYSEFIGDVEWGYNRDKEQLPQINVCMLVGEQSGLPVFQSTYSGSLKDVSTLKTTLQLASGIRLINLSLVMDKGFCSKKNIDAMIGDDDRIRFIISTPLTMSFTKSQIESERKDIDSVDNTVTVGDDIFRAVTKKRAWSPSSDLFTHVYYNAGLAYQVRNRLYGHIASLKREAQTNPDNPKYANEFEKYLNIRKSAKSQSGHTVSIRYDIIEKQLQYSGWMVIVSNHIDDAYKAIQIYRSKDVVEKGFMRMKNCLDLGRLRVHSDVRMQNKIFIGFIALIIMAHINKVMTDNGMYERMSMMKMIKTLERLRVQRINGNRILFPTTAEQRFIFKTFNVSMPV